MRRTLVLATLISVTTFGAPSRTPADPPASAQQPYDRTEIWNAIVHEHVESSNALLKRTRSAKTDAERDGLARKRIETSYELCRRALDLAKKEITNGHADDHLVYLALDHVLLNPHDTSTGREAAELAIRFHRGRLSNLGRRLAGGLHQSAAGETVLREFVDDTDSKVRVPASVHLAHYLLTRSELSKQVAFMPEYAEDLAKAYGPDYADFLTTTNGDRDAAEAEKLLETALTDYGDLLKAEQVGDRTLDEVAREKRRVLRHLTIGVPAPVIEGADVSGNRFSSREFDGKVRVLYFWGHWCVGCRRMYPKATAMREAYDGAPFAFLGINSDKDPKLVAKLIDEGTLTFPIWFDGGQRGPIGTEWAIYGAPHVYVLDAKGTIRWKAGERLDEVVRKLVDEAASKP